MQLYLFNNIKIKPYVILIIRVLDEEEYVYIQNNFENIFEILLEDDVIDNDDLLVFSLIKEYNKKIENFIKHYNKTNEHMIDNFNNQIICTILEKTNCNIMYECFSNTLKKKFCNINMGFLIEKYL